MTMVNMSRLYGAMAARERMDDDDDDDVDDDDDDDDDEETEEEGRWGQGAREKRVGV
jgi:hypothetical protein